MDPILFVGYAVPGAGKTCDLIYAAPLSLWFAEPPAVRHVARSVCGISDIPDGLFTPPDTVLSIAEKIKIAKEKGYQSVVVDDLTLVAQHSFRALEKKGLDGFTLFKAFRDELLEFRETARRLGIHVFVNAHLGERHMDKTVGRWIRGGPALPGQSQEAIGGVFDQVLRGVRNEARPVGWTTEWHCADDDNYVTKDRLNVVFGTAPMNISEIVRARGYKLPRYPGMEWLDEAIKICAQAILASEPKIDLLHSEEPAKLRSQVGAVAKQLREFLSKKYNASPTHQNWVLRDAIDRVIIRSQIAERDAQASLFGG